MRSAICDLHSALPRTTGSFNRVACVRATSRVFAWGPPDPFSERALSNTVSGRSGVAYPPLTPQGITFGPVRQQAYRLVEGPRSSRARRLPWPQSTNVLDIDRRTCRQMTLQKLLLMAFA